MKTAQKVILILAVLCLCAGCDQATKAIARQHLAPSQRIELLDGIVILEYTENIGAFLSLGARLPETIRFWTFTILVGAVLVGMLIFVLSTREISPLGVLAMSLIIGGGSSNLWDRAHHNGAVADFINVGIGRLRTGIFNVADVALMAGIGLLLIWSFHFDKSPAGQPST